MQQGVITVKSTKDSKYKFKGKVKGNELKGQIMYSGTFYPFSFKISSDEKSFEGYVRGSSRNYFLIGKKAK